ncbi:hypothetical protein Tco_0563831, partial [Tanacetum coccineum]
DEAVFKEWDDKVVRATTTAASLDAAHASGCTPRSDEGRPDLHEWMDICTKLSDRVLDLEKEKDAQAMEILKLKNKIKNLERKAKSSIPPPKRRLYKQVDSFDDSLGSGGTKVFDDTTAVEKDVNITELISTADDAGTTTSVIPDIDIADLQMSTRPRTTSVVIQDVEEELRRATLVPTVKIQDKEVKDAALIVEFDNVQARMEANALLAVRLKEEEREQFSINEQARFLVETIVERKRFFAVQRAEQIRNKPPTKTQLRNKMITYLKNIGRYTHSQLKNKSLEEIQKLYERKQKWIKDFVPMDSEEGGKKAESSKKEAASSKKRQKADPDDENVKRQKIGEASGSGEEQSAKRKKNYQKKKLEAYQVFADMLKKFDRDDLVKLWDLVKERFSITEPTDDKEKELYMHDPLVCSLYDTCGVHHVSSVRGHDIFMLVEKEYPLTRGTLGLMMVAKLLVEADIEMSRELLRKIFYQANRPRQ